MHPIVKFNSEQAAWLGDALADDMHGEMELFCTHWPEGSAAFLRLADTVTAAAALIREVVEDRETVTLDRVQEIAFERMRDLEASIGYEVAALTRIRAREEDYLVEGKPSDPETSEAERQAERAIEEHTRDSLIARSIFEQCRDLSLETRAAA